MAHHRSTHQQKQKISEEMQSAKSKNSFYAGMTPPPPSYHSFEGLWMNEAIHPSAQVSRQLNHGNKEPQTTTRHPGARNEDSRSRDNRRKHHRSRRSSSHNSTWTAKVVFQGLKSGLLGSDNTSQAGREPKERPHSSRKTKMDFSTRSRDIHYTIHNHWHTTNPSETTSRTNTWPGHQRIRHPHHPFAHRMNEMLPDFGSAAHKLAGVPLFQDHPALVEDFFSGFDQYMPEGLDTSSLFEKVFGDPLGHAEHDVPFPQTVEDYRQHGHSSGEWPFRDGSMHDWNGCCAGCSNKGRSATQTPVNKKQPESREKDIPHPPNSKIPSSTQPSSEHSTQSAASDLATYNQRWDYIDTVQHPYPSEIPWPRIRPDVPFDHMKCDVFAFFARGCGLQPDRAKAPKLDFKLSPRSPYPSYDQQQQEWERKMLKLFKQQMQREKLRWHEDKLRRKCPEVIGVDEERRKAVWAAIAEGSAVCDKRLGSML